MPASHEQLIIRHLSGSISPEEQEALVLWLNESQENKKAFDDFQKVWKLSKTETGTPDFSAEQDWHRLEAAIDRVDRSEVAEKQKAHNRWGSFKIAASIAFLLACAALLYLLNRGDDLIIKESGLQEIHFTLADGSEVWLNKGSTLTYPEEFSADERVVNLEGEAFFKVSHNSDKPFIVLAQKARVKVLGTSFNVKAYEQAPVAEVFVLTGKVGLSAVDLEEQLLVLQPGQKGVLIKEQNLVSMEPTRDDNVLAWRTNKLVFRKAALVEVVPALESYFGIELQVTNPALLHCRFTSSFNEPELGEVLEVLRHSLNIKIVGEGRVYQVAGEGCKATGA